MAVRGALFLLPVQFHSQGIWSLHPTRAAPAAVQGDISTPPDDVDAPGKENDVDAPQKKKTQLDGHLSFQPPLDSSHGWSGDDSIFPVNASTPSSVIKSVCSNCALRPPSFVTAVQSSAHKLL